MKHRGLKTEGRERSQLDPQGEINAEMAEMVAAGIDVAEIHSPPRITVKAKEMGLRAGWSLDITTRDSDGRLLCFSRKEMRKRAVEHIHRTKPLVIVGNPMGTDWSTTVDIRHKWRKPGAAPLWWLA